MIGVKKKTDKALSLMIPVASTKDYDEKELIGLMKTYEVLEKAKDSFLGGEITFEEYITLCEKAEVNIDSYLEVIEHNLTSFNLL